MKTLEYLQGMSPADARRLRERGIRHSNQLLHVTSLAIDRERLGKRTGISPDRLLGFANQCALLEISGMDRYLPIVRRLGIAEMRALQRADPEELHARVVDAVGYNGAPTLSMVGYWISQARLIDVIEEDAGEETPAERKALARRVG
ncbi:MAG: DUF4332 domain-containing protein [Candidatus Dormibacteraceae bacterium]